MDKRGIIMNDILVYVILGLIVLSVVAYVFSSTVKENLNKMIGLTPDASKAESSCRLNGGFCSASVQSCEEGNGLSLPEPQDGWNDCSKVCCLRG